MGGCRPWTLRVMGGELSSSLFIYLIKQHSTYNLI
nr:MAG TPA: NADH dehydrogenase [Crassvirales sp.]